MRSLIVAALLLTFGTADCLVQGYKVEPKTAAQSGWTHGEDGYVSEIVTCCWDQLDSASGAYVELFVGGLGASPSHAYQLDVYEYPGGVTRVAWHGGKPAAREHSWLKLPLTVESGYEFTKGKQYEFRFTRASGSDSIQYYTSVGTTYLYGFLRTGGTDYNGLDLAMRCYGLMDTVCTSRWGALSYFYTRNTPAHWGDWDTWAAKADTVGLPWMTFYFEWDSIQRNGPGTYVYDSLDTALRHMADAGVALHGLIARCPKWASSRIDSIVYDTITSMPDTVWSTHCASRNLWDADSNFWAEFVDSLVDHVDAVCGSDSTIHVWHCLNEENDTGPYQPGDMEGWFMHPDSIFYPGVNTGLRGLCSLYMRMASVMASVIRSHSGHEDDTIVIGDLHRATHWWTQENLVEGRTWLDMCYQVCETTRFWNAVAVHPYQCYFSHNGFDAEDFAMQAETLRQVMRDSGDCSELWAAEVGWCTAQGCDSAGGANNLCKSIVSVEASAAAPGGGYDRFGWWHYWQPEWVSWYWSFIRPEMGFSPPGYAYAWCDTLLGGKRFNGRVTLNDTADTLVRIYEFEAPADGRKLWVAWQNGNGCDSATIPVSVPVALPARTDETDTGELAYNGTPPEGSKETEVDGWLVQELTMRPVFISEGDSASRPDLRVDSFRVTPAVPQVGKPMGFYVFVYNQGNKATLDTVWLKVYSNDSLFTSVPCVGSIPESTDTAFIIVGSIAQEWMHGQCLFRAEVNPGQVFVEKGGMDDNSGYQRKYVYWNPTGTLNAVVPPGGMTNSPLALLKLTSSSWESDTSGSVSADSARLAQVLVGAGDTAVLAAETTAWFPFVPNTAQQFKLDAGHYRWYVQLRDSGGNDSPFYPDSENPVVVFDTTAPVGSVVINHDARFANTPMCTLALWASDTLSHVAGMRIGNQFLVNVVENSGFTQSDGHWEFSGGDYGDSLAVAELPVDSGAERWVRQFIPAESIQPFIGDTCVLSADLVVDVPDTSEKAIGTLSVSYRFAHTDTTKPDTFVLVCTDSIYGGVSALVGLAASETSFVLPQASPPASHVWGGAMVKLAVGGMGLGYRSGTLWADNAKLEPCGPSPAFSWWEAAESTETWSVSGACGYKPLWACFLDSAGCENVVPCVDTIIFDAAIPDVVIHEPENSTMVNGTVDMTGWAYDPISVPGDTWFRDYRLFCRHAESTEYVPITPDSVSYVPAYPDTNSPISPYVHLGYWDTEVLENADYWLKLVCTDSAGNSAEFETWVTVFNEQGDGMQGYGPEGGGSGLGEGSIYVGSATGRVVRYSEDLDSLETFTLADSGNPAYVSSILSLDTGHLLIADARTHSLSRTTRQGQDRTRLVSNLGIPAGITKDASGNIWLCDRGSSRIAKFSSSGNLLLHRGGQGDTTARLNSPEAIAVKSSLVYVADAGNNRITVWDTAGNFRAGISGSFQNPRALAITDSGTIYTIDHTAHAIEGLNQLGGHLVTITTTDTAPLKHLLLSHDQHSIFTLRPGNNRILKYRIKSDDTLPGGGQQGGTVPLPKRFILYQPWPNPAKTRLNIRYGIPRATRVTIKLYDIAGKLTRTLASDIQKPGYYNLVWNRTDNRGRRASAGVYFCTLSTDDKRLSRKVVMTQ